MGDNIVSACGLLDVYTYKKLDFVLVHLSLGPLMLLLCFSERVSGMFQLQFIPLQDLHKFVFQPCISGQFVM